MENKALLVVAIIAVSFGAVAQESSRYKTITFPMHHVTAAKTVGEVVEENPEAVYVLDLVASYVGCPGCVSAAAEVAKGDR